MPAEYPETNPEVKGKREGRTQRPLGIAPTKQED
jgi:hypothetical protein